MSRAALPSVVAYLQSLAGYSRRPGSPRSRLHRLPTRIRVHDQLVFAQYTRVAKSVCAIQGEPDLQYLEIGVYEGRSAIWMLENVLTHPTARLTGIDIFEGPYKDRYLANLQRSGSSDKATTVTGYSQLALRELPFNSFDIIYIDGSHAKDDVLEDAILCWRLLKNGGVLIFDDYRWCGIFILGTSDSFGDSCKPAIEPFVQCFDRHFEVIHNSYQLIVRKKQNDAA